jgi:Xaa-Pro aminopeptidase
MNYKGRQELLQRSLHENRLDALLVTHLPNIRYLCGFTGSAGALLVSESKCVFFTDRRYTEQVKEEVKAGRPIVGAKGPLASAGEWLKSKSKTISIRLGVEDESLTVAARQRLASVLPAHVRLKFAHQLVERARMVKDRQEIILMREAAQLGAKLFDRALQVIRPGISEMEIAGEMEFTARRAGADEMSFPTIIASGARSALPHGRASRAALPARGFVVCDFGVILAGYCSDETRTVHIGNPSREAKFAYEAVREAQQAAVQAVKPGATAGEVDGAARRVLRKAGLARYFTHSTGHGVGLEIHESPRIAAGQKEVLRPGMAITIEPGVYLPGKWGIRIEDTVVVTNEGCEVLTPTSKELFVM